MVNALTKVLLLGAASFAAATSTDNAQDGTEAGIDCGPDGTPCTCYTDLDRVWVPPTLINSNQDRDASDTLVGRETGIVSATLGGAALLEVAFTVDGGIYTSAAPLTAGKMLPNSAAIHDSRTYTQPRIYFVDQTDSSELAGCTFTTADDLVIEHGSALDGTNCITTGLITLSARRNVRTALSTCGFVVATGENLADNAPAGLTNPARDGNDNGVTDASTYTKYTGAVHVETSRQGGAIRKLEIVKLEEYSFQISLLFPENIQVTASAISVIGSASHQTTLTHSIFSSTDTVNQLDMNALFGSSYPYAVSTSDLTATDTTVYTAEVYLNATTSKVCTDYFVKSSDTGAKKTAYDLHCITGGTPHTVQSVAGYNANVLCDIDNDQACTIADIFTVTTAPNTPYDSTQATSFTTSTPGGVSLPATRCMGANFISTGGTAEQTQNDKACLQNIHSRLTVVDGWCDTNVDLVIRVNAVCRDDLDGTGAHTGSFSVVQDSFTTVDTYTYVPDARTGDADLAHLDLSTQRLFLTGSGETLPCDSLVSRDTANPATYLYFTLASDNFCPVVVATGTVTALLNVFESEFGAATWGADCATDGTTANTCTAGSAYTDASCVGTPGNALCKQVPFFDATRVEQDSFVFGTTTYLETTVHAEAGVNIASTTIENLFVGKNGIAHPGFTAVSDDLIASASTWYKRLVPINQATADNLHNLAGTALGVLTELQAKIKLSDDIVADSLILSNVGAANNGFFTTGNNPNVADSNGARLGPSYEGVSRVSLLLDEYTILITDEAGEAAEEVQFFADLSITYEAAASQLPQAARSVQTQSTLAADAASRARLLTSAAVAGGQASARASVSRAGSTGSSGSASTIAGFSSTTVLAVAAVMGAIVVAAGSLFFVTRKRRTTADRMAKRSSSSTELNDTLAVQA